MLLASVIALASFVALVLIYFALTKYMEHKKAQAALPGPTPAARALDDGDPADLDDPVTILDPVARDEMLENARAMARDNPEHAAKLLRTWLDDEK